MAGLMPSRWARPRTVGSGGAGTEIAREDGPFAARRDLPRRSAPQWGMFYYVTSVRTVTNVSRAAPAVPGVNGRPFVACRNEARTTEPRSNEVLDAALICHIGFVGRRSAVRDPDDPRDATATRLYIHGSPASRMLRTIKQGVDLCRHGDAARRAGAGPLRLPPLDELPVGGGAGAARRGSRRRGEAARRCGRSSTTCSPGRWDDCGRRTTRRCGAQLVLALPITEASAKIRTGPPIDDDEDYELPIWAGVVPLVTALGEPRPDPKLDPAIPLAGSVTRAVARDRTAAGVANGHR